MMRLWYQWQLCKWTRKTREAKARWMATEETIVGPGEEAYSLTRSRHPTQYRESKYCDALIEMRYYEKLLGPIPPPPVATAKEKASTT